MYRGRRQLGQEIALGVLCVDAAGTPVTPDRSPRLKVWDSANALILDKDIPALDRYRVTGLFQYLLFLQNDFAAGRYTATYTWHTGSYAGVASDYFEIAPGGNVKGVIVAMTYYHRPQADFVVSQTTAGKVVKGRNPSVL